MLGMDATRIQMIPAIRAADDVQSYALRITSKAAIVGRPATTNLRWHCGPFPLIRYG